MDITMSYNRRWTNQNILLDSVIQKGTDKQKKAATIQDTGHTDTGNTINAQTGTLHAGTSHAIASLLYPGVLG